jgi:hypothetical protein
MSKTPLFATVEDEVIGEDEVICELCADSHGFLLEHAVSIETANSVDIKIARILFTFFILSELIV